MNVFPRIDGRWKEHGQILMMFALYLAVFLLFTGLAIDFGLTYLTRARLSKALDSACLNAARVYSPANPSLATNVAKSAFSANYGTYTRDTTVTGPTISTSTTGAVTFLNCNCSVTSKTFFARILPNWSTVTVSTSAQARHATLIMTIVLDISGSMGSDGGLTAAKAAIPIFLAYFDNTHDYVGLATFGTIANISVPVTTTPGNFVTPITNTVNNLSASGGYTFTHGGLIYGQLNNNGASPAGNVAKVIVLLTDGYANLINDTLTCTGTASANYGGCDASSHCTTVSFFNPSTGASLGTPVNAGGSPSYCAATACTCPYGPTTGPCTAGGAQKCFYQQDAGSLYPFAEPYTYDDAEFRATDLARILRLGTTDPNNVPTTIYTIGVGNNINKGFLEQMANDPAYPGYNSSQPAGAYEDVPSCGVQSQAACTAAVQQAFQNIAANILLRLTQ
jgi:Flp pilus assembly protein TadG